MTLPKTIEDVDDYKRLELCDVGHTAVYYNSGVDCPMCKAVHLNKYYVTRCIELKDEYETLYQSALRLSPEILL